METTIVNKYKEKYDIYIGRGSKWGNPFEIGKDGTREEVIEKYEEWIKTKPNLMNSLHELEGKKLGCFCKPKGCHGDVLVKLVKIHKRKIFSDKIINSRKKLHEEEEKSMGEKKIFAKELIAAVELEKACMDFLNFLYNKYPGEELNCPYIRRIEDIVIEKYGYLKP